MLAILEAAAAAGIAKMGAGIGAGLATIGAGLGIGRIGGSAMEASSQRRRKDIAIPRKSSRQISPRDAIRSTCRLRIQRGLKPSRLRRTAATSSEPK